MALRGIHHHHTHPAKHQNPTKCQVSRTKYPTIFHFGNNSTPLDAHIPPPNHLVAHKSTNPQHQTTPQPIGGLNFTPQPIGGLLPQPTISLTSTTCYPQALFISPSPQRLIPPSIHPPIKQKTPIVETTGEHKKKLN
jgi:hypothetical protein